MKKPSIENYLDVLIKATQDRLVSWSQSCLGKMKIYECESEAVSIFHSNDLLFMKNNRAKDLDKEAKKKLYYLIVEIEKQGDILTEEL